MTRWTLRASLGAGLVATLAIGQAHVAIAQSSIVIVTGGEASVPVPTLMEGPQAAISNYDIADQLFLRLAELGPTLMTAGDRAFEPALAKSWTRRDSLTLAFDLDPRATWQDGVPVTAKDVVFTFGRARDPAIAPGLAKQLRNIASVTAEGERRVVVRFTHYYAEQLYDAVFHVAPLPAHLLASLPPASLASSSFVQAPVGSGPYRWVRRVPGQFVELAANEHFFLGVPAIRRVFFRLAADADARLNMVLSGEADAMDNIPPPRSNLTRVAANKDLRVVPVPSSTVGFLLFNQRDPNDRDRPHPILADTAVRRAIGLSLDRRLMVRATFGNAADVPYGPASPILWIRHGAPAPRGANVAGGAAAARSRRVGRSGRGRRARARRASARPDVDAAQHERHPPAVRSPGPGAVASGRGSASRSSASTSRCTTSVAPPAGSTWISPPRVRIRRPPGWPRVGRAAVPPTSGGSAIRSWTRCSPQPNAPPNPTPGVRCCGGSRMTHPRSSCTRRATCTRSRDGSGTCASGRNPPGSRSVSGPSRGQEPRRPAGY